MFSVENESDTNEDSASNQPDVIEFSSTIMCLGGRRTFNFIQDPCAVAKVVDFGSGKFGKSKMNLGGPSESFCESRKTPFTAKPGIIKCLSLLQYKLVNCGSTDSSEPIINNKNLLVYPCVYSNNNTVLKSAVEFNGVSKTSVGLSVNENMEYVKANTQSRL